MKLLLIIHAIYEILIGITMIGLPSLFLSTSEHLALSSTVMYGITAIGMGMLSAVLVSIRDHKDLVIVAVSVFAVFHLGIAVDQLLSLFTGIIHVPLLLIHAAFAYAWIQWVMKRTRPVKSEEEIEHADHFLRK